MAESENNTKKDKTKTNFMDLFDNKKRKNNNNKHKNNKSKDKRNITEVFDRIRSAFISLYTDENKQSNVESERKSDSEAKKVTFDEKTEPGCQLFRKIFSTNTSSKDEPKVLYEHVNNTSELSLEIVSRDRNPLKTIRRGDEEYVAVHQLDGRLQYISISDILDSDEKEESSTDSESFNSEVAGYFGIYSKYDEPIELDYNNDDDEASEQSLDDELQSDESCIDEADLKEKGSYNIQVYENFKPFFEEDLEDRRSFSSGSTYRRMYIRNKHYNVNNSEKEYRFGRELF